MLKCTECKKRITGNHWHIAGRKGWLCWKCFEKITYKDETPEQRTWRKAEAKAEARRQDDYAYGLTHGLKSLLLNEKETDRYER